MPHPLRLAGVVEMLARHLDRALDRLGAGVGHEHRVGEGRRDQPLRQRLLVRDAVEVRGVPQPSRLLLQRLHQRGVRVAEQRHGDAGAEVEVALAALLDQPGPLPLDESQRRPRIGRQDGRNHGQSPERPPQTKTPHGGCGVGRAPFAARPPPSQFGAAATRASASGGPTGRRCALGCTGRKASSLAAVRPERPISAATGALCPLRHACRFEAADGRPRLASPAGPPCSRMLALVTGDRAVTMRGAEAAASGSLPDYHA